MTDPTPIAVQYTIDDLRAELGDAYMQIRALTRFIAKLQAPQAPGAPSAPSLPVEMPIPEDEQAKLRAAFGLPADADLSLVGANGQQGAD